MGPDNSDTPDKRGIAPVEQEISIHLERAHELGERAKRSNDQAQIEIDRALEIAERLRGHIRADHS